MTLPAPVQATLEPEEAVAAEVPLKGEDALYVTQRRTIVYRADGLLSDESADAFPHDAERVGISAGRRKSTVTLDYGLDGERSFGVPSSAVEEALHPVLAGVLNAAGVTGAGETVTRTYRFSELTLVVTNERVVKHVGEAVWDQEFEEIPYADVTGLRVEDGNVSSQLVFETDGRTERVKAPNEEFRDVRERVTEALCAYYDVASLAEFESLMADDEEDVAGDAGDVSFESDLDPIALGGDDDSAGANAEAAEPASEPAPSSTDATASAAGRAVEAEPSPGRDANAARAAEADVGANAGEPAAADGFEEFETAVAEPAAVEDRLRDLQRTLDRQRDLLAEQQALVEELAAELSRKD